MAIDPKQRTGLSKGDQEFLGIIDEYGWHVMYIAPRKNSDDEEVWWGYSTGLYYHFQKPEIVLFGLSYDNTVGVINNIGNWLKEGNSIEEGKEYFDFLENCGCMFKTMDGDSIKEYLCWADWFYERADFPVMQCFWPDKNGRYPWQPGCDPSVIGDQPQFPRPTSQ